MDWPGRIYSLEQRAKAFARTLADVLARLARAEVNIQQSQGGGGFGGGGAVRSYWCRTPGTVAVATGTWPSLTPTTFTADVYLSDSGALTSFATGATIYWWYKDAAAANKLVGLLPNGDGTYDARHDSCTAV
jgi:hypothetical protein